MIDTNIKKIAKDIKNIKIQGASKIETAGIKAIEKYIEENKLQGKEFISELIENINYLIKQRPNEPKLRNSMNYILVKANKYKFKNKEQLIKEIRKYDENIKKSNEHISELASEMITNDSKILTHCHSNLVEKTLKKAYDKGINFEVYSTETRPRYQGHITAKKLSDYGIKTTTIVDSSVANYMKKIDFFLTGADVVFADGSIMNKVGTYAISIVAKYFKTPHRVITSTHCCESNDILNLIENPEERSPDEVWDKKDRPKKLNIKNPCFDIVPNELIDKFITEEGVFSPETLYLWTNRFNIGNNRSKNS